MQKNAPIGRGQHQTASNWNLGLSDRHLQPCTAHGVGFSSRHTIDFNAESVSHVSAITPLAVARSQSDRGLDLADPSPKGERSARGRGKSERSERNDGGCCDHAQTGGFGNE